MPAWYRELLCKNWRADGNADTCTIPGTQYAIDYDDADIDTFIARRPDGLAFDKEEKLCVFLEYTRAMDTTEDWAERICMCWLIF